MRKIDECIKKRKCSFCAGHIFKGEKFIDNRFEGWRESNSNNICGICIKRLAKEIKPKEHKAMISRRMVEVI